ncbi:hypothetical protein [Leptospira weilii]|nr:hypothetical protein [Leptospira weilii]
MESIKFQNYDILKIGKSSKIAPILSSIPKTGKPKLTFPKT